MGRSISVVVVSVLVLVLAGCPDRSVSALVPEQSQVEEKNIPLVINNDVDILFVIDNSGSMDDEQASLIANFDRFIDVLDNIDGGLPDVHIGVATSDMGSLGVSTDGQCSGNGDGGGLHVGTAVIGGGQKFLSDVSGATPGAPRVTNYDQGGTVTLSAAFGQTATVGIGGCGFEQHLESMRTALDDNPLNLGFVRPDAHLAVVIVADEDDCSAYNPQFFGNAPALGPIDSFRCFDYGVECDQDPRVFGTKTNCHPRDPSDYLTSPSDYVEFLTGLKSGDAAVIVAGIVGDREPVQVAANLPGETNPGAPGLIASCTYDNPNPAEEDQTADPAIRLGTFIDAFTTDGRQTSICSTDLSGPLEEVGELIAAEIGNSCIKSVLVDTDLSTPEPDYECQVSLISGDDAIDPFDHPIPQCDAGQTVQPCWRLIHEDRCNTYPTQLAINIVGAESEPSTTHISASCVVE